MLVNSSKTVSILLDFELKVYSVDKSYLGVNDFS